MEPTELSRDVRKEPSDRRKGGREGGQLFDMSSSSSSLSVVDILKGKGERRRGDKEGSAECTE